MAEPVETFLGWTGVGFGVILVYAAFKGKGPIKDIIKPALMTGKIPSFSGKGTSAASKGLVGTLGGNLAPTPNKVDPPELLDGSAGGSAHY
jgi:hypothetical protein